MFENVAEYSAALKLQCRFLRKKADPDFWVAIDDFLEKYCSFYNISAEEAARSIEKFNERYQADIGQFLRTGKYPYEIGDMDFELTRQEYDLFLISSMMFTGHRHAIGKWLYDLNISEGNKAFIGVGSGLELKLVGATGEVTAFDLSISEFARKSFSHVSFVEDYFVAEEKSLDVVYAIEILEHVRDPFDLVATVATALKPGGIFYCSIAVNIPQFDHLLNMNDREFEKQICSLFTIEEKVPVPHDYRLDDVGAHNILYALKKKRA